MQGRLSIYFSDRPALRFYLDIGQSYVLGRDDACDMQVVDERVSRRHARFEYQHGRWCCEDLGSKNGLRVNGFSSGRYELEQGAWLDLGGLVAQFETLTDDEFRSVLARRQQWREQSAEITARLDARRGLHAVLHDVLESVLQLSGTQRGCIMLAEQGCDFEIVATRRLDNKSLEAGEFSGSLSAIQRAINSRTPVVVCDAMLADAFSERPSIVGGGIRALLCLPLELSAGAAVVYADSCEAGKVFEALDVEILKEFSDQAALAIDAARVRREIDAVEGLLHAPDRRSDASPGGDTTLVPMTLGELLRTHGA